MSVHLLDDAIALVAHVAPTTFFLALGAGVFSSLLSIYFKSRLAKLIKSFENVRIRTSELRTLHTDNVVSLTEFRKETIEMIEEFKALKKKCIEDGDYEDLKVISESLSELERNLAGTEVLLNQVVDSTQSELVSLEARLGELEGNLRLPREILTTLEEVFTLRKFQRIVSACASYLSNSDSVATGLPTTSLNDNQRKRALIK